MNFFRLTEGSDKTQDDLAYIEEVPGGIFRVNALRCAPKPLGCGHTWRRPEFRIFKDLPESQNLRAIPRGPVDLSTYSAIVSQIRSVLHLRPDDYVPPGAVIGHFSFLVRHKGYVDLVQPSAGPYIVSSAFVDF